MKMIMDIVNHRMAELNEQASALADEYWVRKLAEQEARPIQEWGQYGVRVRRQGFSISIEWSYTYFIGEKGNRSVRSKYLPRGRRNHRYPMTVFRKAPDWEYELIDRLEGRFGPIREEVAVLRSLRDSSKSLLALRQKHAITDAEPVDLFQKNAN